MLPFDDLDEGEDGLAVTLVEDLTTELARRHRLPVIARNSAFATKGRFHDVPFDETGPAALAGSLYARCLLECGRREEATEVFQLLSRRGFQTFPRDIRWIITTVSLAHVCAEVGGREEAELLLSVLHPAERGSWGSPGSKPEPDPDRSEAAERSASDRSG